MKQIVFKPEVLDFLAADDEPSFATALRYMGPWDHFQAQLLERAISCNSKRCVAYFDSVRTKDFHDYNPLRTANNNPEMIELLLENASDSELEWALLSAAQSAHAPALAVLLPAAHRLPLVVENEHLFNHMLFLLVEYVSETLTDRKAVFNLLRPHLSNSHHPNMGKIFCTAVQSDDIELGQWVFERDTQQCLSAWAHTKKPLPEHLQHWVDALLQRTVLEEHVSTPVHTNPNRKI